MKDKASHSSTEILRQKAEEILKNKSIILDTLCLQGETLKLIHELDVHQIELEMKNEELLLAKEQIETASEKYIDLYDFAPSGYFTLSRNGEIHKVNFKGANMLGKERSLLLNNRFAFFLTDESKSIFSSFLDRIFESKIKETCEVTLSVITENPIYLLLNGITVEDREECFITAVDISKRKAVEKELRENEEKYHTLFDSNRDSITIFRLDSEGKAKNFIETNAAATAIYGYTKEELMTMNVRDLEPISQKTRKQRIETLLANGRLDLETIIKTKKGKFRNVEIEVLLINYLNEPAVMNITRDITERKQIEINAKKSQENLVTILEAIPDLLFEVDQNGMIHHYQSHRLDLLAFPPEIFMGKRFQDVIPVDPAKVCMDAIEEASKKGWSSGKQYSLELSQGKHWFELAVSTIKESDPKNKHFILLARDITVRKLAEIALQENEEKLLGIFNVANSGIIMIDAKGKFVLFNDWCCDKMGYSREEFSNLNSFNITYPDDYDQSKQFSDKLNEGQIDKYQIEKRYLRKDKSFFWGEISVSVIKDENNKYIYSIGIITDITERKLAEEQLSLSKTRFSSIIESSPVGMAIHDDHQNISYLNQSLFTMFGYTLDDIPTVPDWFLKAYPESGYRQTIIDKWTAEFERAKQTGTEFIPIEATVCCKNGTLKTVLVSASSLPSSTIGEYLIFFYDISDRKQAEAKLIANENFLKQTQIIANLGSYSLDFSSGKWTSTAILDSIFGIDADFERTADGWESIIHPDWKTIMHDYLYNEVIGKKTNFNKEYKIIKVDSKEERWVHGMFEITFNKKDQPLQLIGSIQDITERKLIEEKLKKNFRKVSRPCQFNRRNCMGS